MPDYHMIFDDNGDEKSAEEEATEETVRKAQKEQQRNYNRRSYSSRRKKSRAEEEGKEEARETVKETAEEVYERIKEWIKEHPRVFIIGMIVALVAAVFAAMFTSCGSIVQSGAGVIAMSTYPSEDADMLAAEAYYCGLEADLQSYLDAYESTHDCDAYVYDLDTIEHDPYNLISYLTAWNNGLAWTVEEMEPVMDRSFQSSIS